MKQGDFTEVAKHYHNRPAYSEMLLEKLIACVNDEKKPIKDLNIVEVGAGTGKLTQVLAGLGCNVLAIEPNDNMRQEGIKATEGMNVKWQKGSGEQTGVDSHYADWVIMASSFHWTDPKKSLPEFARILKNTSGGGANILLLFGILEIYKKILFFLKLKMRLNVLSQSSNALVVGVKMSKNGKKFLSLQEILKIAFLWNAIIMKLWIRNVI